MNENKQKNFKLFIEIEVNNEKMKDSLQNFINELNFLFDEFNKNYEINFKRWQGIKTHKKLDTFITPESIELKSPLTILTSEWGMGKTYFLEELVLHWPRKEINEEFINKQNFDKLFVIDLWRHTNFSSVHESISKEIYEIILSKFNWLTRYFFFVKKIVKKCFLSSMQEKRKILKLKLNWLKIFSLPLYWVIKIIYEICFILTKLFNKNEKNFYSNLIEKVNKKIKKPIIVCLDNIERIEDKWLEVIKTIQIFSSFKNFVFILTMNKSQIKFSNNPKTAEEAIEKYISLGKYFKLEQSHKNLLKNLGYSNECIDLIIPLIDPKSSIRQINKIFNNEKIIQLFQNSKYSGLNFLRKIFQEEEINQIFNKKLEEFFKNVVDKIRFHYFKIREHFDKHVDTIDSLFKIEEYDLSRECIQNILVLINHWEEDVYINKNLDNFKKIILFLKNEYIKINQKLENLENENSEFNNETNYVINSLKSHIKLEFWKEIYNEELLLIPINNDLKNLFDNFDQDDWKIFNSIKTAIFVYQKSIKHEFWFDGKLNEFILENIKSI